MTNISNVAWIFVILNATTIFVLSSITFPSGIGAGFGYTSTFYHFFAFFFLAFFLLIAIVGGDNDRKKYIFLVIIIAILYGVSDEIHQFFVMGRDCSLIDIVVDSIGVLTISSIYPLFLKAKSL